jgi:transcription antitermination factor NusG
MLESRGYEYFLPLRKTEKKVPAALFPGYLFCRLDLSDRRAPLVTTPGVVRLVGNGRAPLPIPDIEIESLRTVLASELPAESCGPWSPGQKVRIVRGPLAGAVGSLSYVKNRNRLIVNISILQRAVSVELDEAYAAPYES